MYMNLAIAAQPMPVPQARISIPPTNRMPGQMQPRGTRATWEMWKQTLPATRKLDYVDHQISLANDAKSAIGRSVVVHAKPDDLKTQPSGDSGARIACGVIGWAKTQ